IYVALACLVVAGGADMVGGIFRGTLWNPTIPDRLRGRLGGGGLLSYGGGPPAGPLRAGGLARLVGARVSGRAGGVCWVGGVCAGGLFGVGAVAGISGLLPLFVRYKYAPHDP